MNLNPESSFKMMPEVSGDYRPPERHEAFTFDTGLTLRVKEVRWETTPDGVRDAGVELEIVSVRE